MQNTSKTREALVKDVDRLKRDAIQIAEDVRDHATAHVDQTKKRVTDTFLSLQEDVLTHPMALLGIGFVVGVLLGFRLRR